jgi:NhaA family Na+:H+ antiporter
MIVPALCYLAVNLGVGAALDRPSASPRPEGWAVPMATDIAFALAVLAVAGRGLPAALRAFLLTLAIVDDLGSILVIALVFTHHVTLLWLAGAAACVAAWWLLQRRGVDSWWIFAVLGVLAWVCTLNSGVHATIAGVAIGLVTNSRAATPRLSSTAERWEQRWRPVSAVVAVPLFALLSAGVRIDVETLSDLISTPLALGVLVALVIGKPLGVFGGAYLTARFTRARLAAGLRWSEVLSASVLAGVGFTVSLLVSELSFGIGSADAESSKTAVLFGSLIAAIVAVLSLHRRRTSRRRRHRSADIGTELD